MCLNLLYGLILIIDENVDSANGTSQQQEYSAPEIYNFKGAMIPACGLLEVII